MIEWFQSMMTRNNDNEAKEGKRQRERPRTTTRSLYYIQYRSV